MAAGDALLSPSVTRRVIERMARDSLHGADGAGWPADRRERQVLELLAAGLANAEMRGAW